MSSIVVPADWRLASALQGFLDERKWSDVLDIDVENRRAVLRTDYTIHNQRFFLAVTTNEPNEWVQVTLFTPFNVPAHRFAEACWLIVDLNGRVAIGRFGLDLVAEASPVSFKVAYDVEGAAFPPALVGTMLAAAAGAFHQWFDTLAELAFTKKSAREIVAGLREG